MILVFICFRAKTWINACGRDDLLSKLESLYESHRLCGAHFETRMFLNDLRNRLQPHAIPTIFSETEGSPNLPDHSYSVIVPTQRANFGK